MIKRFESQLKELGIPLFCLDRRLYYRSLESDKRKLIEYINATLSEGSIKNQSNITGT